MSAELLLREFSRVAEAPGAVTQLRRSVLELAVRGKLVPRNPHDGDAFELLKQMEAHRITALRTNGAAKSSPNANRAIDPPFQIPSWWLWVRLGETLVGHVGGGTPSKNNSAYWGGDIYWATVKDVGRSKELTTTIDRITEEGLSNSSSNLVPPGRLIVVTRMGLGKVSINRVPIAINQDLRALTSSPLMDINFQYIFLKMHDFKGTGLTVKGIRTEELLSVPFPLPPLAEQARIVAKVGELMALCDQLEAAQKERELKRDLLAAALLRRLRLSNPSDQSANDVARFALEQMHRFLARPDQFSALRETVLALAVEGRLVPQSAAEGPVNDELTKADSLRAHVAQSDRRAEADEQRLLAGDHRWPVPETWAWRGLADMVLFIDYRGKTPTKAPNGVRLLTAKNVRRGFINHYPEEFISEDEFEHWMTRGLPRPDDVLFTTEAPMGNASKVRMREPVALAQRIIAFRSYGAIDPDFLVLHLLSPHFQETLDRTATGLTAKGIKAAKLKRLPIAVPPVAEQRRIVAKVHELMGVCDELQVALASAQAERGRLLEALLHEALDGAGAPANGRDGARGGFRSAPGGL